MIPIITGVIASSYKLGSLAWDVETNVCSPPGTTTVYTTNTTFALLIGVVIYSDASLTTPLINGKFVRGANFYVTNGSGEITVSQNKPAENTYYTSCDPYSANPVQLWVTTPSIGGYRFVDCEFSVVGDSSFSDFSNNYDVDAEGIITAVNAC